MNLCSRYEAHYATPLGRKKGSKLSEAEEENMNKKRSNKTAAKYKERQKLAPVSVKYFHTIESITFFYDIFPDLVGINAFIHFLG